jgi:hypothetical protein
VGLFSWLAKSGNKNLCLFLLHAQCQLRAIESLETGPEYSKARILENEKIIGSLSA